jgi:flagellar biosynthesis GTPase FlhF
MNENTIPVDNGLLVPEMSSEVHKTQDVPMSGAKRPAFPDDQEKKRGRRMMGVLLGTLSKFRTEADPAADKQRQIQTKLAEKLQEERAVLAATVERERQEKIERRKEMRAAWASKVNEELEQQKILHKKLFSGFLKTEAKDGAASLYYLPAKLTDDQQDLIDRQREEAGVTAEATVEPMDFVRSRTRIMTFEDDHDSYDDMSSSGEDDNKD